MKEAKPLAESWAEGAYLADIDPKIMDIKVTNMTKQWARWHVPVLGDLTMSTRMGFIGLFYAR